MNGDNVKIGRARVVLPPCPFPVFPVASCHKQKG